MVKSGKFVPAIDGVTAATSRRVPFFNLHCRSGCKLPEMRILMAAIALPGRRAEVDLLCFSRPSTGTEDVALLASRGLMRPLQGKPGSRMIETVQLSPGIHRVTRLAAIRVRRPGGEFTSMRILMTDRATQIIKAESDSLL